MLSLQPRAEPFNLGPTSYGGSAWSIGVAWVCLIWYTAVNLVCVVGYSQIWRYFLQRPRQSHSAASADAPHVTVIRPVKGLEPHLYECLASTFRQDYPSDRLTVCFCISSRQDPGYPTLERLVADFPHAGARLYVEEDDPLLQPGNEHVYQLGPNPKIRNMSRAYREGEGDIVWIIDCNVWIGPGVCGRMVDRLCGFGSPSEKKKKYKFVHHLPLVVDVTDEPGVAGEQEALLDACRARGDTSAVAENAGVMEMGGGRLEELFMSSAHAKMYTAINTVLIAPCIVGKSNMFRRSHLDYLTAPASKDDSDGPPRNAGIDYFSDNICEDHLIGDLLWKKQVREEKKEHGGEKLGKHAMVFGDLAFQPVANMSVPAYVARRVRWLRVRKFTVLLATLVEPGTESFLCSCYGAWGITTALAPWLLENGYAWAASLSTWTAFFALFWTNMLVWILVDWTLYIKLHSAKTVELSEDTPPFARPPPSGRTRRSFGTWFAAWLGRELLALPVWMWAVYGGVTVRWRDRQFRVGLDAKVREMDPKTTSSKARRD